MITRYFNLYLNAGRAIPPVINVNQYDQGESWVFTLYNDQGIKYVPSSGSIIGIKSDKTIITNAATVNASGQVVVSETQQMTASAGKAVFELSIDGDTHGTANFVVLVEKKPTEDGIPSESDMSLIQDALNAVTPVVIAQNVTDWMDDNITQPTTPVVDASLTVQGAAADAKVTGDAIRAIGNGLSDDIKEALMDCFANVAWKDTDGDDYRDALYAALYPPVDLSYISCVYTQSGTVYDTDTLDSLKTNLVVTAHYSDLTSETVTTYTLSGTLTTGTSTITVTYGGKTTTFTVTVTHNPHLYMLTSPFASTNASAVDTGVKYAANSTYSIYGDFTITGINKAQTDHNVDFVFGNKIPYDTSNYIGLQVIEANVGTDKYMWGMGISYSNGKNKAIVDHRYRFVVVVKTANNSCAITLKDVTGGSTYTFSNTYNSFINDKAIFLGNGAGESVDSGFIGTVSEFYIDDGEMASADITAYVNGGE